MAVTTHSFKYKPTTSPNGTEDRVLACSHTTDDCHCVINSSGQIGYYVSGVFTQIGTATVSLNEQYAFIIEHDDTGNGCIYLNGQKIGCATNFPTSAINQIGNFKTELKPETGRKPKVGLKPRAVSNIYTRPCCGIIDEYARFNRALSASEIVDLSQSGTLSKVYTLADYKIALMADDGIIATTEKPRYKENWRSIWNADQRTSALPTAIASITVNGSYKSLATAANEAGIWTPTTNGTPAYNYYQAVESWRQMYFVSSGGGTGFLLTANLAGDTDISAMSPTLESRQSALMFAEDALRSAVMIKRQSTAELTAVANANAYTDELEDALRSQTDHAIVFTTSASDPSTGWTAEENLIHKGDYWRVNTSSAWKTWTGTTWGTVNDAQAQAAANLAQSVANGKTTLYGTLASAKLAAKTGDQFFYNSEIYVCTADLAAAARRYTTKSYGNSATAPVQTTQTVSGSVLTEPLNFGDTYFNTTTKKFYTYTTSWIEDTATSNAVIAYAPKYLGRYYQSHPGAPNNGDWWLVYGLASSPVTRGFWYNNNGTNTLVSTLGTEAQRKYKGSGLEDVLYASNNGYALTSDGVYDPVGIYGVSTMEYLAVNQAFIENLFARNIKISTNGSICGGDRFDSAGNEIDTTKDGFYLGADGKLKANLQSLTGGCVIIGQDAGKNILYGDADSRFNTIVGYRAGVGSVSSPVFYDNSFYGYRTGESNSNGIRNSFFGSEAGSSVTSGSFNTLVGYRAGRLLTEDRSNTFIGAFAGSEGASGARNTFVGDSAGSVSWGLNNNLALGAIANINRYGGDYQINLNNRIRYFEFPSGTAHSTVYNVISAYIKSTVPSYVGAMGEYANEVLKIERNSSTSLVFTTLGNTIILSVAPTQTTTYLSTRLRVAFVVTA